MSTVIRVENLSKYYRLGLIGGGTLHEDLDRWWAKVRGRPDPLLRIGETDHGNRKDGQIWALRDINLEVKEGEILGIIGRNGAGKSTLLKILSRITAPTEGCVKIRGRIGSLLEVGTGFHPELTGRENIYLNGTILGMTRFEVTRKLDEIIAFAEIGQFIDTPVKRYSSGMTVRLAFAVAAHLEPEILIIDEVLAVGDAQFQKKCLGKMDEVGREGRTILFVSHNMGAISQLCSRGILLESGLMMLNSSAEQCIKTYFGRNRQIKSHIVVERVPNAYQKMLINSLRITSANTNSLGVIDNTTPSFLEISISVYVPGSSYAIAVELINQSGAVIMCSSSLDHRPQKELGTYSKKGEYVARLELPTEWMLEGTYSIRVAATIPVVEILDIFPEELVFILHDTSSPVAILGEGRRGVMVPRLSWSILQVEQKDAL